MPGSPYAPFTPKPEQLALVPEVSGNTINGVGESETRRPTYVYWHDPETLHHGRMQKWFYTQNMDHEGILEARTEREKIHCQGDSVLWMPMNATIVAASLILVPAGGFVSTIVPIFFGFWTSMDSLMKVSFTPASNSNS